MSFFKVVPIWAGIVPRRLFGPRMSEVRLVHPAAMAAGMAPVRKLALRLRERRWLRRPSSGGMSPTSWFPPRSSSVRADRLPRCGEMRPERLDEPRRSATTFSRLQATPGQRQKWLDVFHDASAGEPPSEDSMDLKAAGPGGEGGDPGRAWELGHSNEKSSTNGIM